MNLAPRIGIWQRGLGPGDRLPLPGQFGVEQREVALVAGHVFFGVAEQ